MDVTIKINPVAVGDLKNIQNYISEESVEFAAKTVKGIIEKIEKLSLFPEMGILLKYRIGIKSKYRYVICGSYIIFYIYQDDIVYVQRILHGKRNYMELLNEHLS